jgi:PAS domain S-box-containing protein
MNQINPKILIIDDEKGLREGTKRFLESEGYVIDTAENGAIGIETALKNDYDILLIDLKMPDIDGFEVLKQIKKHKPDSIYIISTAYASFETAIESARLGAFSYIPKPFSPDELLYQIEQGFKQRKILLESAKLKQEKEEYLLEIANEKSRLNTIIESISSGVLLINKIGEVVYFNKAALQKLNLNELNIGEFISDKLPTELSKIINDLIQKEDLSNKSITTQIEVKPNGELFVDATCSPVPHSDGSFAGVVVVLKNITDFKKVELIKNQFISMVAHELKSPVSAVLGFIQLILDSKIKLTKEQHDDFLKRSELRLKSTLDLINDLLDISRMEIKKKYRELREININNVIRSVVRLFEFEMANKSIKLSMQLEENSENIIADINEINRIVTNVISNAIKYNKEGGRIDILTRQDFNYIFISIADTGIGLRPEEKKELFQEFFRAKNKYTKSISGTGLGLTIVKRIVEAYHGTIDIESEFEKGTTVIIKLPINKSKTNE